ncbi:unnamed protein product [Strongylus vulgaris]|uniref:Uncharacterized protein n=1 Tax=Strongylus vulgaris TaxID=40348 RepID=A0A3P7LAT3_STRVU|nr:unnamed protein product [Strongylus vulgaris]
MKVTASGMVLRRQMPPEPSSSSESEEEEKSLSPSPIKAKKKRRVTHKKPAVRRRKRALKDENFTFTSSGRLICPPGIRPKFHL